MIIFVGVSPVYLKGITVYTVLSNHTNFSNEPLRKCHQHVLIMQCKCRSVRDAEKPTVKTWMFTFHSNLCKME